MILLTHFSYDIRNKMVKTKHLGTFLIGPKWRHVLLILDSPSVATEVLSHARFLRESSDMHIKPNVFINKDLTKEEDDLAFEKRQWRHNQPRSASSNPENTIRPQPFAWIIRTVSQLYCPTIVVHSGDQVHLSSPYLLSRQERRRSIQVLQLTAVVTCFWISRYLLLFSWCVTPAYDIVVLIVQWIFMRCVTWL